MFGITYIAKVFIKQLYKSMDSLQCQQLIVMILYGTAEVQAGIPTNRREEKKGLMIPQDHWRAAG